MKVNRTFKKGSLSSSTESWSSSFAQWDASNSELFLNASSTATSSAFNFHAVSSSESLNKSISSAYPIDFSDLVAICPPKGRSGTENSASGKSVASKLPWDLRLGNKVRLVCERPFPWIDEHSWQSVGNYSVHISEDEFHEAMARMSIDPAVGNESASTHSALSSLQTAIIYHQHPSIGPVQLFPRRNVSARSTLKSANLQSIEPTFVETLSTEWAHAFRSLLHSWLSGKRRSFYMCSPQFTALFISFAAAKSCSPTPQKTHPPPHKSPVKQQTANLNSHRPSAADTATRRKLNFFGKVKSPAKRIAPSPRKTPTKQQQQSSSNATPKKKLTFLKTPEKTPQNGSGRKRPLPADFSSPRKRNSPLIKNLLKCVDPHRRYTVVITPTTSGLRQIVHSKGIDFKLPFKSDFVELTQEDCPKDFLPSTGDDTTQLDHDEWLREIGISPKSTLRLKRSASELDTSTGSGDNHSKPQSKKNNANHSAVESSRSVMLIRGATNAEAFSRLLTMQPSLCATKTGPQAGLPPTLIAQQPFRHSTQKELVATSQVLKKTGQFKYVVELDQGPVLPEAIEQLVVFARKYSRNNGHFQLQVSGRSQCHGVNEALSELAAEDQQVQPLSNFAELDYNEHCEPFSWI